MKTSELYYSIYRVMEMETCIAYEIHKFDEHAETAASTPYECLDDIKNTKKESTAINSLPRDDGSDSETASIN